MRIINDQPVASASEPIANKSSKQVAHEFEGLLLNELFKIMRQSVPNSSMFGGFSQDVFNSMLDEQLAQNAAMGGGLGLSAMIASQLDNPSSISLQSNPPNPLTRGRWVKPVDIDVFKPNAAQKFGALRSGDRPEACGEGHCGLDLSPGAGTPVRSVAAGIIKAIGRNPDSNGGLTIEIEHAGGDLVTRYLHLADIRPDLTTGTEVAPGEQIGSVGDTGRTSHGAHLHFEIQQCNQDGTKTPINPEPYVNIWPRAIQRLTKP
jgi:murein DD-endopeptidase MepM/ murein hydrolase activator NlpD